MLNRPKVKKESVKKAEALRVKSLAKELFPRLLIIGYSNISHEVKAALEAGQVEQAESVKRQMAASVAEYSIVSAMEFERVWKKKRGQFYAD